ncbi:uncharacterized protein PHACADRAFT_171191 [Phanerochaete carnosa HHB-10118-sp]|uniref:Uncharacterized protein n=1 Tax=Phanerochaete carnosa (strain HHB-10118-sp) TaxID=650164 RepID=K5WFW2_PHACS|nr:uncharacterized protein PHACADRAFT_171191 [Phanerochaete carnosa HHB-10118-sp]EKM57974.1 hypothetical protein PHACADRAFT_171191 [Phanerochaete carnosa HHB-10118-sp]
MTQSLYPTWDSVAYNPPLSDYLPYDHHYPSAPDHAVLDSRPSSSSSAHSFASPRQPRFENASWGADDVYQFPVNAVLDSPLTSSESVVDPDPAPASVKQEDEQDDFVFEIPAVTDAAMTAYPALSSMTEVPLRATQASKEMRRMMGVFRLDPFTMHNAVRDPTANVNWNGEPIGPLREVPRILEFQLEIGYDRVKSEPPGALYLAADGSERSARKRRRVTPMPTYVPDPSPTPEFDYTLADSPSSSPIDDHGHAWSNSSADSHSLSYSPDLTRHQSAFDTVLTPAQGLDATIGLDYGSRYSSISSASPSSSPRQTLAYTTTTPVRLPPPASSRYVMPAHDLGVLGHDVDPVNGSDEGSNNMWARKAVSLGMYYGSDKDGAGPQSHSTHAGQGLLLAQPHSVSTLASRRLASASAGVGAYGGIMRSGRVAWT